MIRASQLPRIRDRMVALLSEPDSSFVQRLGRDARTVEAMAASGRHLATGSLTWVTADMTALACAAGRTLPSVRWASADRPSGTGLVVMDGGVGLLEHGGVDYPVDAVSWGPAADGLLLTLWVERRRIEELLSGGRRLDPHVVPHLIPLYASTLPVSLVEQPVEDVPAGLRTVATTLAAAWHLMFQPTLSERWSAEVDRSLRRAYARADRPVPEVSIVDLRALYRPSDPDHEPACVPGRFSHRWVVSGHWRDQPYGRERADRRRIWITDYVKGPAGAPLLVRERVNVWRR